MGVGLGFAVCFEVLTLKREGDDVIDALKAAIAEEESPHVALVQKFAICGSSAARHLPHTCMMLRVAASSRGRLVAVCCGRRRLVGCVGGDGQESRRDVLLTLLGGMLSWSGKVIPCRRRPPPAFCAAPCWLRRRWRHARGGLMSQAQAASRAGVEPWVKGCRAGAEVWGVGSSSLARLHGW